MKALQKNDWRPVTERAGFQLDHYVFDPVMIKPLLTEGGRGYVGFSCAIIWMMTDGGTHTNSLDDEELWKISVEEVLSGIEATEIEALGVRAGNQEPEVIPAHKFALTKVLPMGPLSMHEFAPYAPAYIECTPITDANDGAWSYDEIYLPGHTKPAWTSLVLRKSGVLQLRPRRPAGLAEVATKTDADLNDALHSDPTDEPLLTKGMGFAPAFLQVATDPQSGDVIVRDATRLSRRDSQLIRELERVYREDIAAGRIPENHRYVSAEKLADALEYQDVERVRKRVCRCRSRVERALPEGNRLQQPLESLIQTHRPDGYRLNPQIRFVSIKEIGPTPSLSRKGVKPVT